MLHPTRSEHKQGRSNGGMAAECNRASASFVRASFQHSASLTRKASRSAAWGITYYSSTHPGLKQFPQLVPFGKRLGERVVSCKQREAPNGKKGAVNITPEKHIFGFGRGFLQWEKYLERTDELIRQTTMLKLICWGRGNLL